ncbi:Protein CBG26699 [Caenorhabditis briggsae]|uniref:Protein CBG26699 n=1 Tax=Caenorhabditis briggsae TaxID=6238 RepID=B6IE69_CAEBR|nr:Protein CBG26699 [Caenorhabditis briggsae]CAS01133.1 Protein CBG26699 [Caenorhabditis briggsae]
MSFLREIEEKEEADVKSKKQRKAEERKEKEKLSKKLSKINLPTKEMMDENKGRYYQGLL